MEKKRRQLLPEFAYTPIAMILLCSLPQAILMFLNARAFTLVRGELELEGMGAYQIIFAGLAILILFSLGLGIYGMIRKRKVDSLTALLIFVSSFGYLWAVLRLLEHLVPSSVGAWMLAPHELAYNNMALIAASLFYGLVLLAGRPSKKPGIQDAGISIATVVVIPLFWAVVMQSGIATIWDVDFGMWLIIFLVFIMTAVMILAFLRLMLMLHNLIGRRAWTPIMAGVVFPIAGLLLNRAIPFPSNLQDWRVYSFTILNAIAISIPFFGGRKRLLIWCGRVMTYPFTLYFFLLFLPFLPLAIPAMVAVGSGFLILAPTLLFVVHSRRIMSEGRVLLKTVGKSRLAVCFAISVAILPAGYIARALLHRNALQQAIDVVYHPDYSQAKPEVKLSRARAAFERLHEMKSGVYAPLLSEIYDSIVFQGMVLPDHKMEHMEKVLFGEAVDVEDNPRNFDFFMFIGSTTQRRTDWSNVRAQPRTVKLAGVEVGSETNATLVTTEIVLDMHNDGGSQAEYVASVEIPQGVAVIGYWLDVEGQRVPGRIFDRKTALWVFHMIRDRTNRDPGVLHYIDQNTLELRVFPFAAGQDRQCGIKLVYPAGMAPVVTVDGKKLQLGTASEQSGLVHAGNDDCTGLYVPANNELPRTRREPYLHFIVNATKSRIDSLPLLESEIEKWLKACPQCDRLAIDLVNFGTKSVGGNGLLTRQNWAAELRADLADLELKGGFWPERAINHALKQFNHSDQQMEYYPVFAIIGGDGGRLEQSTIISGILSDVTVIDTPSDLPASRDVIIFKSGDKIVSILAGRNALVSFRGNSPIEAYSPEDGWQIVEADTLLRPDSQYSNLIELCSLEDLVQANPQMEDEYRSEILAKSRQSEILARQTAYIVVENSAQWEMLKRKEKDSMQADGALNFDEFQESHVKPEPGTWLWLCIIVMPIVILKVLR